MPTLTHKEDKKLRKTLNRFVQNGHNSQMRTLCRMGIKPCTFAMHHMRHSAPKG